MMKALIDADMLLYEVGFGVQYKDDDGELVVPSFERCISLLEQKLNIIQEESWSDEGPTLYLTGDDNFRIKVATTKPYKGNRTSSKPFHFNNLKVYMEAHYNTKVASGMEADDLISIDHTLDPDNTVICTRDKDLRMVPGYHYGWECNGQAGFGPSRIDDIGYLELTKKGITGGGFKFFCSQLITGDSTDNIPGLPRKGPAAAFKLLDSCSSIKGMKDVVKEAYSKVIGDGWNKYLDEQAKLLWICREVNGEGLPVTYNGEVMHSG